jgi:hypothetical protein
LPKRLFETRSALAVVALADPANLLAGDSVERAGNLEVTGRCLTGGPRAVTAELLDKLKSATDPAALQLLACQLLTQNRIPRATAGLVSSLGDSKSMQARLRAVAARFSGNALPRDLETELGRLADDSARCSRSQAT